MSGVMIGYFLPRETAQTLYDLAKDAGLDPTPVEDMHLTLAYLGDTAALDSRRRELNDVMEFIASWLRPCAGKLAGVGRFNASEHSDGLDPFYASCDMPMLPRFRQMLVGLLGWNGFPVDEAHGFTPHVTLSYLDKNAGMPDIRIPDTELRIDNLTLAFGDQRTTYRLVRKELVGEEMPPSKLSLNVSETEQREGQRVKLKITCMSNMAGKEGVDYPKIPLPADIDPGDDPLFVTLPIGAFNAESRNKRTYKPKAMMMLVQQINELRPEGMWGHLRDDEYGTRYDPPALRWVAAMADENGIIWGKCRPLTPEARNYYRQAKLDNARVGTSLFAWAEMDGENVDALEIITIDQADPARVGVPLTAARPMLSTDMVDDREDPNPTARQPVPETALPDAAEEATHAAEGTAAASLIENATGEESKNMPDTNVATVMLSHEFEKKVADLQAQITRLEEEKQRAALTRVSVNAVCDLLKTTEERLVESVRGLVSQNAAMTLENQALLEHAMSAQIDQRVKIESVRPVVTDLIRARKPATRAELDAALEEALGRESVQVLLKAGLQQEMGEPQKVSGETQKKASAQSPRKFTVSTGAKAP